MTDVVHAGISREHSGKSGKSARQRSTADFAVAEAWWPVAFASDIAAGPVALRIGAVELAAYRDKGGNVRAVEDSCPHRRMRLSMGRVTAEGHLRCPYHGWTFDGATGQCVRIPHLRPEESTPSRVYVPSVRVAEQLPAVLGEVEGELASTTMVASDVRAGLVFVWTGAREPDCPPPNLASALPPQRVFERELMVRAPYERVAAALALNPGRALGLGLLVGSGDELIGPRFSVDGGRMSIERERILLSPPRVNTWDSVVHGSVRSQIASCLTTGLTTVTVLGDGGSVDTRVVIGLTPQGGVRTAVHVRVETFTRASTAKARIALTASAVRRLVGRDLRPIEALSDQVDELVDTPVTTLRSHQGVHHDDHS